MCLGNSCQTKKLDAELIFSIFSSIALYNICTFQHLPIEAVGLPLLCSTFPNTTALSFILILSIHYLTFALSLLLCSSSSVVVFDSSTPSFIILFSGGSGKVQHITHALHIHPKAYV